MKPKNQPRGTDTDKPIKINIGTVKVAKADPEKQKTEEWRKSVIFGKELEG